jgi:hypothetical protein
MRGPPRRLERPRHFRYASPNCARLPLKQDPDFATLGAATFLMVTRGAGETLERTPSSFAGGGRAQRCLPGRNADLALHKQSDGVRRVHTPSLHYTECGSPFVGAAAVCRRQGLP